MPADRSAARTRCDTTDSTCAVKGRAKVAAKHGQAWASALAARNVKLTRDQHDEVLKKYPMRGIRWWPKGNTGSYGWAWTGERSVPRWLARLVKRNTFYFNFTLQVGLSAGFVARWKIRYAPSFIQSWARITGRHPILAAEQFTKDGREIVRQEVEKRG